jgi:hypothetical protein
MPLENKFSVTLHGVLSIDAKRLIRWIRWDWVVGVGIAAGIGALLLAAVAGGGMPLGALMRRSSIFFVLAGGAFFICMMAVAMQRLGVLGPYHAQIGESNWAHSGQ